MPAATADTTKRKRPAQAGAPIMVRLQPDQLAALDAWRDARGDAISRPEAIRELLRAQLARTDQD